MSTLRYAWRNLWRNSRRTIITLVSVTLNTAILIVSYALMDGFMEHLLENATNLVVGEVQVHNVDYRGERSFYKSIENSQEIINKVTGHEIEASLRSYGYGLLSRGTKSSGALFWGVNPVLERSTFDLAGHLVEGNFLSDSPGRQIVLGKKLARSLDASASDELVVLVQAADGSLGNDLYTVVGILKSAGEGIDRGAAIIHEKDFQDLFVSEGRIHEIAFNGKGKVPLQDLAERIREKAWGYEVLTWREILPDLSEMVNIYDKTIWIFGAIFFLAAGLGVMNTMLMSTYERIREFGILKALGASPWRILRDVAVEAMILGLLATALGTLLGIGWSTYFERAGLDISVFAGDMSFAGVAFDPLWRAKLTTRAVVFPVLVMGVTCGMASLYPAALAARLDPVRAIHRP